MRGTRPAAYVFIADEGYSAFVSRVLPVNRLYGAPLRFLKRMTTPGARLRALIRLLPVPVKT
jgi:hypothetical protein